MIKKKITTEDLAIIIKKGFNETAKKGEVDKRFDAVKAELTEMKAEIYQMRIDIKQIWNKLSEIEQRLEVVF